MSIIFILVLLLLLCIMIGIIYVSYWIPKKLGNKKLGIVFYRFLIIGILLFVIVLLFDDYLFFKSDAKAYLAQQNVILQDDFSIQNNESGGLMDFYHSFILAISEQDKARIIAQIKANETYQDSIDNSLYLPALAKSRYTSDTLYVNYQTDWEYKKAMFYSNGEGYKPTYRVISVSKEKNELTFEEILE